MSAARTLVTLGSVGTGVAALAWLAAPFGFPFELARHFTPHLCVTGLLLAAAWVWLHAYARAGVFGVMAIGLGLAWLFTPFKAATSDPDAGSSTLTVAVFNAGYTPSSIERAARWADAEDVDVIMLAEAHGIELETLQTLFEAWPYRHIAGPRGGPPGADWQIRSAVFSRWPAQTTVLNDVLVDRYARAVIQMDVEHPGGSVQVTGLHPTIPLFRQGVPQQDSMFQTVADHVPTDGHFVAMGDMNTTPWSPNYSKLPGRRAGDPRLLTTFPAPVPFGGLAIDHIMVGDGFQVIRAERGPHLGADHYPILAELAFVSDLPASAPD